MHSNGHSTNLASSDISRVLAPAHLL